MFNYCLLHQSIDISNDVTIISRLDWKILNAFFTWKNTREVVNDLLKKAQEMLNDLLRSLQK